MRAVPESTDLLHFLLVPDSGAARRLRRLLATNAARAGVVVGVWQELVDRVRDAQVLPEPPADWETRLHAAMAGIADAFWAASYRRAPVETAAAVAAIYRELLEATGSGSALGDLAQLDVGEGSARKLADLARLQEVLAGAAPPAVAQLQAIIGDAPAADSPRRFVVYHHADFPRLSALQQRLLAQRDGRPGAEEDPALRRALTQVASAAVPPKPAAAALAALRAHLYTLPEAPFPLDNSLQWLALRDHYEEAEVAAGMVQQLLSADSERTLPDIGLLLPDDPVYEHAVRDAFSRAGIGLAGMPDSRWERDLGRELIGHFLTVRQTPAPAMALASCLDSPLMPWSGAEGAAAAQRVIDGDWQLSDWHGLSPRGSRMLALLRRPSAAPAALAEDLSQLTALLDSGDALEAHRRRAQEAAGELRAQLDAGEPIDWVRLRQAVLPERLAIEPDTLFSREGLTVWREGVEPWRPVEQLLVLGFSGGHYPRAQPPSAVFPAQELDAIACCAGLDLDTRRSGLQRRRRQFLRQLRSVSGGVTFLIPRRDALGDPLTASESLEFMLHLFGLDEGQVLNLDLAGDRKLARHLALSPDAAAAYQPPLAGGDLALGRDLLQLRRDAGGRPKPESPSALEALIVSPLAWLLQRLHAEPALWLPEAANVLLLGSLAHTVFEHLFPAGAGLPQRAALAARVRSALDAAIEAEAPFLRSALWRVDRRQLESELVQAAEAWREVLIALDAEVIGNEVWLQGDLRGLSIHGQADALLALPDDRLLIVDFKKSSARSRRTRMAKGYDSQVELYRQMIRSGGVKDAGQAALGARLRGARAIGVVYFTLNDQVSLSDTTLPGAAAVPGWETLDEDVAGEAMALIDLRVEELRRGRIRLNRRAEMETFEKDTGITPYALDTSPLVTLFMREGEGEEP